MERLGQLFARIARRLLPDPMVIACGLTLFVIAVAIIRPSAPGLRAAGLIERVPTIARMWFAGVWSPGFLAFALQMCVVLLTGYGLAKAPPAMAVLRAITDRVRDGRSAVWWVALISCTGCWINWGFGLIAGGLTARELRQSLARRGVACNGALLVAAAYGGMMIWHGGLSGSAPLKMAEQGVEISAADAATGAPIVLGPVSIRRTVLSGGNLILTIVVIAGIPWLLQRMAQPDAAMLEDADPPDADRPAGAVATLIDAASFADRLNHSRALPLLVVLLGLIALGGALADRGMGAVDLNFVNLLFLALGLALHRNLGDYVAAVAEGGRAITGIVLQFPLYSGLHGVMVGSGIAAGLSQWFVDASQSTARALGTGTDATFPIASFFSAALVNLFVPSGGGQWIVQGPIMCGAGEAMGLPVEQTVMAISYGDQWTNMVQPFWAIPLMGLTGVNVRQFMGYCALLMLLSGPVFLAMLVMSF